MTSDQPPFIADARADTTMPGPGAVAGALLFSRALQRADLDPQTQARVQKAIGDMVGLAPLQPGRAAPDRTMQPDALRVLVPSAAVVAAGLDPAKVPRPPPPVLWTEGNNSLLVRIGEVHADLLAGAVVLTVPVACDETGPVDVTVSFVTGTPDAPTGGVATTEDHPRGPAPIVETWAEPLVAFAWQTLVVATSSLSGAGGNDFSGRNLVAADFAITEQGLTVTPQAAHTFIAGGTL